MKNTGKSLVCLLLVLLLAATLTGCPRPFCDTGTTTPPETTAAPTPTEGEKQELGEGDKLFYLDVTFSNGETSSYAIHTDADTVGAALVDLNLIAGDDTEYGLYVMTIGEETLDYDTNGMYWAFYENGEYAMTGVDSTAITDGMTYAFVATKG